jgi:hypothetical protein
MTDKQGWFIIDAGRGLGADIARDEPSHIHVPRPSRVARAKDQGTGAHRPVARFQAHADAYADLSTSVALDDLQLAGNRGK